jgi:hypothetical protein
MAKFGDGAMAILVRAIMVLVGGLVLMPLPMSSYARDGEVVLATCPSTLTTHQEVIDVPDGFNVLPPKRDLSNLMTASFVGGPLAENGVLAPDDEKGGVVYWRFGPSGDAENWMVCHYSGTNLRVARKLPSGVRECRLAYRSQSGRRLIPGVSDVTSVQCVK